MVKRYLPAVLGGVAAIYGLTYFDLTLRARSAYLEGEKYMSWHRNPELRKEFFDGRFKEAKARFDTDRLSGKMQDIEYNQRLALAQFERDNAVSDSSLKDAYHWFKAAAVLCSPPESRWVTISREKMAEAKRLWKAELDAAKIPYQDYMLE